MQMRPSQHHVLRAVGQRAGKDIERLDRNGNFEFAIAGVKMRQFVIRFTRADEDIDSVESANCGHCQLDS